LKPPEYDVNLQRPLERNFRCCKQFNSVETMEPEDDRQLWDVLGRVPKATLSPLFARNVLRKIRQEAAPLERARNWFSLRRLVAASAVAVIVVGMAIATHHPAPSTASPNDLDVVAKVDPQDYDVVVDLDELIAWDENSVWDEKPTL
jgi:hypothetical protein